MERLPGFRDFYPEPVPHPDVWSAAARQYVFEHWRKTAQTYGFTEYDGPPLEPLDLFTTKSGDEIVGQLYNFIDKGQRAVALRPEMTPTLARMVAAHARSYKKPIKWFAIPQLFRYERQQKGRLREHFQLNADIVGESDPAADAELISLLIDSLRSFGLTSEHVVIRLSSRDAWQAFYRQRGGTDDKAYAFFQVIDKLDRDPPDQSAAALRNLGFSRAEIQDFIQAAHPTPGLLTILENLDCRGLSPFVKLDYGVIRGLAYYTGTVFEAFDRQGELRAIAGGGRYDRLIHLISGGKVDLPALGFGMGDVVLLELLQVRGLLPSMVQGAEVYCLIEDESLRAASLGLIQKLRQAGRAVEYSLTPLKPDKQFKRAMELDVAWVVKLGRSGEVGSGDVIIRNLRDRSERAGSAEEVLAWLAAGGRDSG